VTNRLTSDWCGISRNSADAELQGKRDILRSRSRDGEQNDPYIENYLTLMENNVIGSTGITLQMKVQKSNRKADENGEMKVVLDQLVNTAIEDGWEEFGERDNFLVTRNMDSTTAWKLILRTMLRDGSCLIRKVRGYPLNKFRFGLQLFEGDYLDTDVEFRYVACSCAEQFGLPECQLGKHEVRFGVELQGDWKFPVAYWLRASHPGDVMYGFSYGAQKIRVPVDEMIHPFIFKRIDQHDGIPALVAAMLRLQMLGGYDEAALVSARAAAQKMGFLEKEIPDSLADQFADEWENGQASLNSAPGEIEELPMGVKFKEWNPTNPNDSYAPFVKTQLRGAACAGGVSYTSLANDIESVNYSSIRSGLLEEREGYKGKQQFFIKNVVREVYKAWLPMAILSGAVDVPFSRLEEYLDRKAAIFKGRRWPWVDPTKDVDAAIKAIDYNLKTKTKVIAEGDGDDYEDVVAERAYEVKLERGKGLPAISPDLEPAKPAPADPNADDAEQASGTDAKNDAA
jgi:lambda family phage portal protein